MGTPLRQPIHKVDIPAFHWPKAPFPQLRYPLEENVETNEEEQKRCLEAVERIIDEHNGKSGRPTAEKPEIAAVIVEPIQAEAGDRWASATFFRSLRDIVRSRQLVFIVDEVQTGVGVTGKFWAHEHWDPEPVEDGVSPPADIVTFSNKVQLGGFFYRRELRPSHAFRNFNTWLGDPARLIQATTILEEIRETALLERVRHVSVVLKRGLTKLAQTKRNERSMMRISNVRGQGTFMAFDLPDPESRDSFLMACRIHGVHLSGCGERTVRLRPMLVFGYKEARVFIETVKKVIYDQV